jgi:hypothetical protein
MNMSAMGLTQIQVWWGRYKRTALHFIVLTAGVLVRELYEQMHISAGYRVDLLSLTLALAGSVATFPVVQWVLERSGRTPNWLRLLFAFQYGFCWRTVLGIEV